MKMKLLRQGRRRILPGGRETVKWTKMQNCWHRRPFEAHFPSAAEDAFADATDDATATGDDDGLSTANRRTLT